MGQTDSKPSSGSHVHHDDLNDVLVPPTLSSSTSSSLIYQNIPYTSYSYEKLPSKQEIQHQQQQQQQQQQQSNQSNQSSSSSLSSSSLNNNQIQQQQQNILNNSYNKDEIITLSKVEKSNETEQELERLAKTPHFFPLLNDNDESWITPNGNPLSVADMDNRGALNISIDIQNYLKNSTGYIVEKQMEIINRIREVEMKQSKKLTHSMSTRVSETTHYNYGFKEVTDKVKFNIIKTNALVYRIGDLIEQIESALPENERENIKELIYASLPRNSPTYNPPKFVPALLQSTTSEIQSATTSSSLSSETIEGS
ncbi:hypothetical protein PPL_02708 [Heterostelium album PN500]|uniref:Uncharacterized protein n=1 Tax=Heterostelium pallidum (strain ATCC 26659 / Pp 5 / PN500) TaxID=670386 RepID=D3B2U4_HETP5|nr:hypothetical protein PPL_02708 [Heterostelium album PN500]EFA83642.1 hypothetical protein PPL_02708 [Heterostelium album PN500]|eukprot:XP_020435759.1 hypothetical protein PPL_02708 [Heterostelium album PN500]